MVTQKRLWEMGSDSNTSSAAESTFPDFKQSMSALS